MQSDEMGLVAKLRGELPNRVVGVTPISGIREIDFDWQKIKAERAEAAAAIERLVAERDEAREAWKQAFDLGVHHQRRAEAAEALLDFATFSPWLREWCRRRFGKWITHNTAKGALTELRARNALGDT